MGTPALCVVPFDELDTARERTDEATEAKGGRDFPKSKMFRAPQRTSDIPGAFDTLNVLLTKLGRSRTGSSAG